MPFRVVQRKPDRNELWKLYVEGRKSAPEIAKLFGVKSNTVFYWLKFKYGIPLRSKSEALEGKKKPENYVPTIAKRVALNIRKEVLMEKYWKEGKSIKQIAKELNTNVATIHQYMKKHGVPRRGRIEAIVSKPNGLERRIIDVIEKANLPFRYVGNGDVIINGKCPDFISTDGSKRIIEIFGDYWHLICKDREYSMEKGRKDFFAKFGFRTLILWESELEKMTDDDIERVIKQFC